MVVRSHHRLHLCANYTLFFLLLLVRKQFQLRFDFLLSLGLLCFQSTKLWTDYYFSLDLLLLFDGDVTHLHFLFFLVTVVDTDHLRLDQVLDQKGLALIKATFSNEVPKLTPIVLRSQHQSTSFTLSNLYLYLNALSLHLPSTSTYTTNKSRVPNIYSIKKTLISDKTKQFLALRLEELVSLGLGVFEVIGEHGQDAFCLLF